MAYEKQTWATGDVITAAKLNHMEDGIAGGITIVDVTSNRLDKTWQEIFDPMKSGTIVFIKTIDGSQAIEMDVVTDCTYIDDAYTVNAVSKYTTDSANGYPTAEIV